MYLNICMDGKYNKNNNHLKMDAAPTGEAMQNFEELLCLVGENKDKQAFSDLFEYFAPRIKSFLMKGGANEAAADELTQETFLTIWNRAETFNPKKAKASTWVFTIARNKRIDALRKIKGYNVDFDAVHHMEDDGAVSPYVGMANTQENEVLYKAIEKLPKDQADLLQKSFYSEQSHNEIAEETGIPLGTVKSRIRLALERLRKEANIKELWQ